MKLGIFVYDPRFGLPHRIKCMPDNTGYMWWNGELREINEIHYTRNGVQIELYK